MSLSTCHISLIQQQEQCFVRTSGPKSITCLTPQCHSSLSLSFSAFSTWSKGGEKGEKICSPAGNKAEWGENSKVDRVLKWMALLLVWNFHHSRLRPCAILRVYIYIYYNPFLAILRQVNKSQNNVNKRNQHTVKDMKDSKGNVVGLSVMVLANAWNLSFLFFFFPHELKNSIGGKFWS